MAKTDTVKMFSPFLKFLIFSFFFLLSTMELQFLVQLILYRVPLIINCFSYFILSGLSRLLRNSLPRKVFSYFSSAFHCNWVTTNNGSSTCLYLLQRRTSWFGSSYLMFSNRCQNYSWKRTKLRCRLIYSFKLPKCDKYWTLRLSIRNFITNKRINFFIYSRGLWFNICPIRIIFSQP